MRPSRLPNLSSRQEFGQDWLDIEHRSSVDRVEFRHVQLYAVDADDLTNSAPDAIGPGLTPLRENPDRWPVLVIPWVASTRHDFRRLDLMEEVKNLDVGEITQTLKRIRRKMFRESNASLLPAPEIIFCSSPNGLNEANRLNLFDHGPPRIIRLQDYPIVCVDTSALRD